MPKKCQRYYKHLSKLPSLKSVMRLFYKQVTIDFDKSLSEPTFENPSLDAKRRLCLILEFIFKRVKFQGIILLSTLFQKIVSKSSTMYDSYSLYLLRLISLTMGKGLSLVNLLLSQTLALPSLVNPIILTQILNNPKYEYRYLQAMSEVQSIWHISLKGTLLTWFKVKTISSE